MKSFKISCIESNPKHTKFNIFDSHGANCGTITILTSEVEDFVDSRFNWAGSIDWNGKIPKELIE